MEHRNLNGEDFSAMSIDDIISRGFWNDWVELRNQILVDNSLYEIIRQVCLQYTNDKYAQRYHFWMNYVNKFQYLNK
jgi:hypothetical protein